jgi:carboxymethylenebutenolidase
MREMNVTVPIGGASIEAFVARPDGDHPAPAVILAHEGAGLDDDVRALGRRFAGEGYLALAPDLPYRRGQPAGANPADLVSGVNATVAYARSLDGGAALQPGIVGFGLGGFVAILAACRTEVTRAVSFYGEGLGGVRRSMRSVLGNAKKDIAPILCVLGSEDAEVHAADVGAVRARLSALRVPHEIVVYPRARNGFMSPERSTYQAGAATDAWTRTLAWLARSTPPPRQPRGVWTRRRYLKR